MKGDDEKDTPNEEMIQNEMKRSEMQKNNDQDIENDNADDDDDDDDDAQKAGEDVMEFGDYVGDADLVEGDEDDDLRGKIMH